MNKHNSLQISSRNTNYNSSNREDTNLDFELIMHLPGLFLVKDLDSRFLSISSDFAKLLGWHSSQAALLKTDYDIPSKAAEGAPLFIDKDKKALVINQKILVIDIFYTSQWHVLLGQKTPIKDKAGKVIGVMCHSTDITHSPLFKWCHLLNNNDQKIINTINKPASYILNSECSSLPLTSKQQECLFLLIRGKLPKQIADILGLSVRTIEERINSIREKLGCNSKAQLIAKAIDSGFFYYIPENLVH